MANVNHVEKLNNMDEERKKERKKKRISTVVMVLLGSLSFRSYMVKVSEAVVSRGKILTLHVYWEMLLGLLVFL